MSRAKPTMQRPHIRQYYNRFARRYEARRESSLHVVKNDIDVFSRMLPPHAQMLDAGCGPGIEAQHFHSLGHTVTGLDLSDEMIALFRTRLPKASASQGDICHTSFCDNEFEAVYCAYLFPHLDPQAGRKAFEEIRRILKPAGLLFFGTLIGSASEDLFAHQSARELGLEPTYFHTWDVEVLKSTLSDLGFHILFEHSAPCYPNRPELLNVVCRLDLTECLTATTPIHALGTSWRSRPLRVATANSQLLQEYAGISRIAHIEGLAGFPVPLLQCARPLSRIAISIAGGKGTTEDESKVSAIMEAVEHAASEKSQPGCIATYANMSEQSAPVLDAAAIGIDAYPNEPIAWSRMQDFESADFYWAPTTAVGMVDVPGPFVAHSNGLAAGFNLAEAVLHGMLEVLERHAWSIALLARSAPSLDVSSIDDAFLQTIFTSVTQQSLTIEVKDLSDTIDVPCYSAVLFNAAEQDSSLINGGFGCHPDALIALRRAVTEAMQSRATVIAGAREDITEFPRLRGSAFAEQFETFRYWYEPSPHHVRLRDDLPLTNHPSFHTAIQKTLDHVRARDQALGRLFVHIFPSPPGVWIVRTLIEGAELFGLLPERMSPRFRQMAEQHGQKRSP